MRILLIGGQDVPGIGGVESYIYNLAKELNKQGHATTILCCGRVACEHTVDNIKIIKTVCPKANIVGLPLLFFKSIKYIISNRKDIDAVNFQSIYFAFIAGIITNLLGIKTCYTIHSLAEDNPLHNFFMKHLMKIMGFISVWLCGKHILTISNSKAAEIKKRYGKKATVIPCAISLKENFEETDILSRYGIKAGKYYFFIGRIVPIKNIDILIKAFIKREDNLQLVIAGGYNTKYGKYLKDLAKDNPNIMFIGPVMGNDKETLIKNCYASCLVSSSEGMPISLLEAMQYAKPCIVTEIPAIQEIIKKEWGYWCKIRDIDTLKEQMNALENEYPNACNNGEKMKRHLLENYTWDKIAKKYIEYLNSIGVK